jgi:hypothetical protein
MAQVTVVFAADTAGSGTFDVWELMLDLDSDSPRLALNDALSISRTVLDDADNREALGYSTKPVLCAVKSLHSHVDLPRKLVAESQAQLMLTKVMTISESDFQKLRHLEDIATTYRVIHLEED